MAIDDLLDPQRVEGSGAHDAGLHGDHHGNLAEQLTRGKTPLATAGQDRVDANELGMSGGVPVDVHLVPATCDHLVSMNENTAHGHLAGVTCSPCLHQRFLHKGGHLAWK